MCEKRNKWKELWYQLSSRWKSQSRAIWVRTEKVRGWQEGKKKMWRWRKQWKGSESGGAGEDQMETERESRETVPSRDITKGDQVTCREQNRDWRKLMARAIRRVEVEQAPERNKSTPISSLWVSEVAEREILQEHRRGIMKWFPSLSCLIHGTLINRLRIVSHRAAELLMKRQGGVSVID